MKKETDTVFITKYALEKGILKRVAKVKDPSGSIRVSRGIRVDGSLDYFMAKSEWCKTERGAKRDCSS
tara:strand:+ start:371 stop:574 length:204 start_codon:yes stop_codon:yes gene_type:complete